MTVAVLGLVWVLWPLLAFAGGLALAPLNGLAGLLVAPGVVVQRLLRPRWYMAALLAFLVFAGASALWSPRPFEFLDINLAEGDANLRSEVARIGLGLLASALLLAAVQAGAPERSRLIYRFAAIAIGVQLAIVMALAAFQQQALDLFAPMMSNEGEGVQNITRNALLLAAAVPLLALANLGGGAVISVLLFGSTFAVCLALGADAGALALLAALLCFGVVRIWPQMGFRILALGAAGAVLAMPALVWVVGRGASEASAEGSWDWRLLIWNRVLEEIQHSPVWGRGIGVLRTIDETIQTGPLAGNMLVPNHSHNMAMQLWAETGAIGAGLLALTLVLAGWRLPSPASLGARSGAVAGLIGAAGAIGAVSFDLWNEWWWAAVSLLAVAVTALCRSPTPEAKVERSVTFDGDNGADVSA